MKYRIHWWYDDMGSWEIEPDGSEEAREYMQEEPLVELDPELVDRYRKACREYSDACEEIRRERDRQLVRNEERKWIPRNPS
jgi:hypothetical protein